MPDNTDSFAVSDRFHPDPATGWHLLTDYYILDPEGVERQAESSEISHAGERFRMDDLQPHRVLKDRRTKNLTRRLAHGDIALIHHADLDTTAARALVESRVAAVVNAAQSISGRYPNRGPGVLLEAGIPLLDHVGSDAFDAAPDGQSAVLMPDSLRFENGVCLHGILLTPERVAAQLEAARENLSGEL